MKKLMVTGLLGLSLAAMIGAVVVVAEEPPEWIFGEAIFSTSTTQTIFNGGLQTLHHGDVHETPLGWFGSPVPVGLAVENFLPRLLGIDALHDMQPQFPGLVFSTVQTGFINPHGTPQQLFHNKAYYYNTLTGEVTLFGPLANLTVGSLDALAALPDGVMDGVGTVFETVPDWGGDWGFGARMWLFSTASLEFYQQDGQTIPLYPGNIYCYDSWSNSVVLFADTAARGVRNIDALNVPQLNFTHTIRIEGPSDDLPWTWLPFPVAFSTAQNEFVVSSWGLSRLYQNDMYLLLPSPPNRLDTEETFDGNSRRLQNLDAYSTRPAILIPIYGDCDIDGEVIPCLEPFVCEEIFGGEWSPSPFCL